MLAIQQNKMYFILIFFINFVIVKSEWFFYNHQYRDIGEPCLIERSNENGICKLADDCSSAFRNPFCPPSYCGYYDATPVVCCPATKRINDSCFNPKINLNGKCKLENDCKTYQGVNSQKFELCGYSNNVAVVCCSEQTQPVLVQDDIVDKQQTISIIGQSCTVNTTSEKGSCKLVEDCELLLDAKSNLCDTGNSQSVVCCPSKKEIVIEKKRKVGKFKSNSDYEELPKECSTTTGEKGVHKLLEHCPAVQKDEQPIICEEEFCRDIVCCPIDESSPRKRLTCLKRDDPSEIIINRLSYHNLTCITKDTNRSGVITTGFNCLNYDYKNEKNYPKVCKFKFCEFSTCCEKPKIANECQYANRKYDTIRIIGDSCTDKKTGLSGTCSLIQQCLEVSERNVTDRTLCGYNCCTDVVCCPERRIGTSGSMCSTYSQSVYAKTERFTNILPTPDQTRKCLKTYDGAVSFGVVAEIREFPFMAALGYDTPEKKWLCGGTLISEKFVMTAGHCARSPDFGPVKYVLLGVHDLNITESGLDCPEEYQVSEIIPHPDYNVSSRYNDIALLRLNENVALNLHILPACLPVDSQIPERLTAMGWGATGSFAPPTDKLTKVQLTLYSKEECSEAYKEGETGRLSRGIMEETQMCAGSRIDGQDTCVGDSGGPIQTKHNYLGGVATVYGITSFGRACGFKNNPSVYTRVFPYVKWIESIVWQ